jgi:hypothetical protein
LWGRPAGKDDDEKDVPLGWVNLPLFDYKHQLRSGLLSLNLWPNEKANPIGTCIPNSSGNAACLFVEFDSYSLPLVFPTEDPKGKYLNYALLTKSLEPMEFNATGRRNTISAKANKLIGIQSDNFAQIDRIISMDPLYPLTPDDKKILWMEKDYCKKQPKSLPKFLLSASYNDRNSVQTMHK